MLVTEDDDVGLVNAAGISGRFLCSLVRPWSVTKVYLTLISVTVLKMARLIPKLSDLSYKFRAISGIPICCDSLLEDVEDWGMDCDPRCLWRVDLAGSGTSIGIPNEFLFSIIIEAPVEGVGF